MSDRLSPQQKEAARLLGAGTPRKDVAEAVGVNPATVTRWGADSEFHALVEETRLQELREAEDVHEMLKAAINARDERGRPDWRTRIAASRELRAWRGVRDAPEAEDDRVEFDARDLYDDGDDA